MDYRVYEDYRLNRNPMLTGTLCYLAGFIVWLWTWQALLVWGIFFVIMFVQVLTEEKRLRKDFGEEYEAYCKRTRRFLRNENRHHKYVQPFATEVV